MFLLIQGSHIGAPKLYTNIVGHKDLRLGQIVDILVFYNISFSWLLQMDGFHFIFLLRDSQSDLCGHRIAKNICWPGLVVF